MMGFWIILLQILSVLLFGLLTRYIYQKGKNWADSEDLNKLTTVVEEIKNKYIQENEYLKAELNLYTSKKVQLFNEEKDALIQFYSQFNQWLWLGLKINIIDYNHTNFEKISEKLIQMNTDYSLTNVAFGKIDLLVKNDEIIKAGNELIIETLKLHHFLSTQLENLKHQLSWERILVNQFTDKNFDFRNAHSEIKSFFENRAKEIEKEKKEIKEEYFKSHNDYFKKVLEKREVLRKLSKSYLNEHK